MTEAARKRSFFRSPFSKSSQSKQPDFHVVSIDSISTTSSRASEESTPSLPKTFGTNRLRKQSTPATARADGTRLKAVPAEHARAHSVPNQSDTPQWERDKQTGELVDHTEMLHSLGLQDDKDDFVQSRYMYREDFSGEAGEIITGKLTPALWNQIFGVSAPADLASLAMSCKAFYKLIGTEPWSLLDQAENHRERTRFLFHSDQHLPNHLLCFSCARFHRRIQPGRESLKPTNIHNPLFTCPHVSNPSKRVSRIRITTGRTLPFTFVQLATRSHRHTSRHGIPLVNLSRRWKDSEPSIWSHTTRFEIVDGHLLMRVISTCFPPPPPLPPAGQRRLLYSPGENFAPYFSTCPHWRDGNLMPAIKCALSHIPVPLSGSGVQRLVDNADRRWFHPVNPIVTLCPDVCRPMRRCPECPTEYLIEIKMAEDRSDPDPRRRFKQALVVTRWSDLGDGSGPFPEMSKEWAALSGNDVASAFPKGAHPSQKTGGDGWTDGNLEYDLEPEYDSFAELGKRAVSGTFEAESTITGDTLPGQRMINMNPKGDRKGEEGHEWY